MVGDKIEYEISQLDEEERNMYFSIRAIISGWDPLYLLINGAPNDEYHCEASRILEIIKTDNKASKLEKYFDEFFDSNLKKNKRAFMKESRLVSRILLEVC